jgi:hypothetical protein
MSSVSQLWQKLCDPFLGKLLLKNEFLTALDIYCPDSGGHKAVMFSRNTYLHRDYNLKENHSALRRLDCGLCWFDME